MVTGAVTFWLGCKKMVFLQQLAMIIIIKTCGLIQNNFTTIYENIYTNINFNNEYNKYKTCLSHFREENLSRCWLQIHETE